MNWDFSKEDLSDVLYEVTKHYKTTSRGERYFNTNTCLKSVIKKTFEKLDIEIGFYSIQEWHIFNAKKHQWLGSWLDSSFVINLYNFISKIQPKYIVNKETAELYHVDFFDNDYITLSITKGSTTTISTIQKKDLDKYKIISYE